MEFTVVGIERYDNGAKIKLEAKHPGRIYISQLFLHIPWSDVKHYQIESKHLLFPVLSTEVVPICDGPTLKAMRGEQ